MGCELQLQDDVRSAKAEKQQQQLLQHGLAARRSRERDISAVMVGCDGASVDEERSDRGLKSGLVFEDCRVLCELSESRENCPTLWPGAFSDCQDRYTCTQTHPVSRFTRFVCFQQLVSPFTRLVSA
jgi:hypothetical protein